MNVNPIQSGDGSQAVSAGAGGVPRGMYGPGFGPTPTPNLETNVTAPLDVRGAPGGAQFIAGQLQQSLSAMRFPMMEAARAQGMEQARQLLAQGRSDASAGTINKALLGKNNAYNQGVNTTLGQKYGYALQTWVEQQRADPQSGWSQMTPQQIANTVDAQARKTMGGMENDPYFASSAAPIVQHAVNEAVGWRIKAQHASDLDSADQNVANALHSWANGGPAFNYQQQFQTYKNLFGGNGQMARARLDQQVVGAAIGSGNAQYLDAITPAPGQQALPGRVAQMVEQARASINVKAQEQLHQQQQANEFSVGAGWDQRLANKQPIPFAEIQQQVDGKKISPAFGLSYAARSDKLQVSLAKQSDALRVLNGGGDWATQVGVKLPDGHRLTMADFQNAANDYIDKIPEAQRPSAAVAFTREHPGLTYEPLKETLSTLPLTSESGVKQTLDAYQQMENTDPAVAADYFPNAKRLAEVHQMLTMRQQGMSNADIAAHFKMFGMQPVASDGVKVADVNKAVASLDFQHHWFGRNVTMANIANPGEVRSRILALSHLCAQSGALTGQQCVKESTRQVLNSSYVVDIGPGRSLVIPRSKTDPPTSIMQPALESWYQKTLPGIAKSAGYTGNADDLRLVPSTIHPGNFILTDPTGQPVVNGYITMSTIAKQWQTAQAKAKWASLHDTATHQNFEPVFSSRVTLNQPTQ